MPLGFGLNDDQPFVVRLKDPLIDLRADTGVTFVNTPALKTWESIVGESPICHPLALMALFHNEKIWNDVFRPKFANHLLLEPDDPKLQSVDHFLKNETEFNDEESRTVKHPIPFQLSEPELKNNRLSFYVRLLYGNLGVSDHFSFSLQDIANAFLGSQQWVISNLELTYYKNSAPDHFIFSHHLKQLKKALASDFDSISLGKIFETTSAPPFYKMLWKAIDNDLTLPGILRYKMLVDLYEKIVKGYLIKEDQDEISKILLTPEWEEVVGKYFHQHTFIPWESAKIVAKKAELEAISTHMTANISTSVTSTLAATYQLMSNQNLIAMTYLPEISAKLIHPELNALMLYFYQQALYRVILSCTPESNFEKDYLLRYVDKLKSELLNTEKQINVRFNVNMDAKTIVADDRMIDKEADADILALNQSPFAWQELLEQFQIDVALQNFALGYQVQTEKSFQVKKISKGPLEFEVKYAGVTHHPIFKIRHSPAIERYLRGKTQETLFSISLAGRVNALYEKLENNQKEISDAKQARLRGLFSPQEVGHWSGDPRIAFLRENLLKFVNPPSPPLSGAEKINVVIYALVAAALEDQSLIPAVVQVFEVMVSVSGSPGLFTAQEMLSMIAGFQRNEWTAIERVNRKTNLILALIQKSIIQVPSNLKLLHPSLESVASFQTYMKHADLKTDQINDGNEITARDRAKFIRANFKREHDQFANADIQAILKLYVYLTEADEEKNDTVNLLDGIATRFFNAVYPSMIRNLLADIPAQDKIDLWIGSVLFRTLAQSKIYNPMRKNEDQTLPKLIVLSFADVLLDQITRMLPKSLNLDKEKQTIKKELEGLEHDLLKKDVIPWYHTNIREPLPDVAQQTPGVTSTGKRKVKRQINVKTLTSPSPLPVGTNILPVPSTHGGGSSSWFGTVMTALTEDPMKKRTITFEDMNDPSPSVQQQPSQPPIPVPPVITDYTAANRAAFKDAINNMVARFRPAVNATPTPYYDPAAYIDGWLRAKSNLTELDRPQLDIAQGKDLGADKLIKNYQTLKEQVIVWAKDDPPPETQASSVEPKIKHIKLEIPVTEAHFALLEKQVGLVREKQTELEKAILHELTELYNKFIDRANTKHKSALVLPEISDIMGKIEIAPVKQALVLLDGYTKKLAANFKDQKQKRIDAKSAKATAVRDSQTSLLSTFKKMSLESIESLSCFEQDLKAQAKVEVTLNTYANIIADGQFTALNAPKGNHKKLAELLRCASDLRYKLLSLNPGLHPVQSLETQYHHLIEQLGAEKMLRSQLTLWKPWHWTKIFKYHQKIKAFEKEKSHFDHALTGNSEVFSPQLLSQAMPGLLEKSHNLTSPEHREQVLWTANKLHDNAGIVEYQKLCLQPEVLRVQSCVEALEALKVAAKNYFVHATPPYGKTLSGFIMQTTLLIKPPEPNPNIEVDILTGLFDLQSPLGDASSLITSTPGREGQHQSKDGSKHENLSASSSSVPKQQIA